MEHGIEEEVGYRRRCKNIATLLAMLVGVIWLAASPAGAGEKGRKDRHIQQVHDCRRWRPFAACPITVSLFCTFFSGDVVMNRWGILVVLIGMLHVPAFAQDATEPRTNVAYEKLKVLEPLMGTWSRSWIQQGSGIRIEVETTYSWSPSKLMIVSKSRSRFGDNKEWIDGGAHIYYAWNEKSECIEQFHMYTLWGRATVNRVLPKEKGVFELISIHDNLDVGTSTKTMTISENEIRILLQNQKDPKGAPLEDEEQVFKRISQASHD